MAKLLDTVKIRRSIYNLTDSIEGMGKEDIESIVAEAALNVPSAFNMQSSRTVLLFGESHKKLWSTVLEKLRIVVPAERFSATESKIKGSFASGYGTVLYLEDYDTVNEYAKTNPLYKDNFPIWSQQASGMLQHTVWCAFAEAGIGASLQHYNPIIDDEVKKEFDLPASWKLIAQMPFGGIGAPAGERSFSTTDRLRVFKG